MSTLLPLSPGLLWFLTGLVFLLLELVLPGLIVFFFGLGAWCTALAVLLFPISLSTQLLIFLVSSLLSLVLLRSALKKVFRGQRSEEGDGMRDTLPDSSGIVVEAILPPATGRIKCGGTFWQASATTPIPEGAVVRIIARHELVLHVESIKSKGEL
ncbi:MAG: NfeD family protein [Desulfobulbus sp.]|jgi:membrane protein implicated in regulation of membrane protease activity